MSYIYYPGCSLKSTGRAYEESMLSVLRTLEIPINELEDWNCCGATAYMSISELKAIALSARILALAERQSDEHEPVDLVVPCAACYLGLNKALHYLSENEEIRAKVNTALLSAGLSYSGRVRIRHSLDFFINEIGCEKLSSSVIRPLEGLRVACYYGCQIIRPYADFDDQHTPTSMDRLMKSLGADIIDWPLKTRCCGGSLTGTVPEVGLRLSYILLKEADRRNCDAIVTACPLCQFNLECYQSKMSSQFGDEIRVSVVYFTQLIGHALGIPARQLAIHRLFAPPRFSSKKPTLKEGHLVRE